MRTGITRSGDTASLAANGRTESEGAKKVPCRMACTGGMATSVKIADVWTARVTHSHLGVGVQVLVEAHKLTQLAEKGETSASHCVVEWHGLRSAACTFRGREAI